jgi:hypothetical protein
MPIARIEQSVYGINFKVHLRQGWFASETKLGKNDFATTKKGSKRV